MRMLFLYILPIIALLTIFVYILIKKHKKIKYTFILLIYPFIELILIIFERLNFKYPVLRVDHAIITTAISLLPFCFSYIYLLIKKNCLIKDIIYGLLLLIVSNYCLLWYSVLYVFNGTFYYSYTTDKTNYLKFDEKIKDLEPYDISYFPTNISNLKVIKYKYELTTSIDTKYDIELIVQYSEKEYENEYKRIKSLDKFINIKDSTTKFIKKENYCEYDCYLNYIGFNKEKYTVTYAVTHREGDSYGIPKYFQNS